MPDGATDEEEEAHAIVALSPDVEREHDDAEDHGAEGEDEGELGK
ncbi:hypothetical protein N9139_01245 [Akkermansiaceae bacterium]|nr:hypothetical protein [Akkermansiaceae bacterium]